MGGKEAGGGWVGGLGGGSDDILTPICSLNEFISDKPLIVGDVIIDLLGNFWVSSESLRTVKR